MAVLRFDQSGNASFGNGDGFFQGAVNPLDAEFNIDGVSNVAANAGDFIQPEVPLTGLQRFGQGLGNIFKSQSITDPNTQKTTVTKSPFERGLGVLQFGLNYKQMQDQMDLMEDMQKEAALQNRRSVLGTIESANRSLESREYNRLRMQGLSDEQARKGADQFVADRGLTPEEFGVKPFSTEKKKDTLQGQSPLRPEEQNTGRIVSPFRLGN
jgi:hypothetical protein